MLLEKETFLGEVSFSGARRVCWPRVGLCGFVPQMRFTFFVDKEVCQLEGWTGRLLQGLHGEHHDAAN